MLAQVAHLVKGYDNKKSIFIFPIALITKL